VFVAKIGECEGISRKANTIHSCHNATAAFLWDLALWGIA